MQPPERSRALRGEGVFGKAPRTPCWARLTGVAETPGGNPAILPFDAAALRAAEIDAALGEDEVRASRSLSQAAERVEAQLQALGAVTETVREEGNNCHAAAECHFRK